MKPQEIMQEINQLLDDIVTRTLEINKKNFDGDYLLDIDLVQDDVRHLYRRLEMLRSLMATYPGARESLPRKAEQEPAGIEPPAQEGTDVAHTREKPGQDEDTVPSPPKPAPETSASAPPPPEPATAPKPEHPEAQAPPPEPNPPLPHQEPPQPEEKKAEPEKDQPRPNKNNGNRAVIDILSEYSDRTIGDAYLKEEDDSIHKKISFDKEDKSIGERMQRQPVSDLKDVIGVNEKFLFINELFDGNIQAYNDAVARLNNMEDVQKAFDYLNSLGMEYAWDASRSADTIEKLAMLIQRRYIR